MALTNDDIQSRNRKIQDDLAGAQTQRANLTALRTASQPTGFTSAGGYAPAMPRFRTPIDRINYETAASGMAQNDATMKDITQRAGALTNDANNYIAQQTAARYGVNTRPQIDFSNVQTGAVSSYDKASQAGTQPAPAAAPSSRVIPSGMSRTINLGASNIYGGGGAVRSTLASSVDRNGVPTYDNSSIQRMLDRDGQAAPVGGASAPDTVTPPPTMYAAQPVQPQQPVGAVISGTGTIGGPQDPRRKIISDLDSTISRLSMNPNSRGKRAMLENAQNIKAGYINNQDAIAAASANLAASQQGETQRALISQAGEDRRSTGQINAQLQLEGIRQTGENSRHARLLKQPVTAADGRIGIIGDDGVFRALKDQDGNAVSAPTKVDKSTELGLNDRLKSYDTQIKTLTESLATAADADKAGIQQQIARVQNLRDSIRGDGARPAGMPAGAQQAPDGNWYVQGPNGYLKVNL